MWETIKNNWKRYLQSTLITFVATFLLFAVPQLLEDTFTWTKDAILGVMFVAVRLGVKAAWEIALPWVVSLRNK